MIEILLSQGEYVVAAKKAGIYSHLQMYIYRIKKGERPEPLPGEEGDGGQQQQQHLTTNEPRQRSSYEQLAKPRAKEKAINYFQSCLEVLGLEEEVALTEDALKKAYKKAAIRAHPDKGGNEAKFEAVTRAYAYLTEIIKRIHGGRTSESKVEAPTVLKDTRHKDSSSWQHAEPIRLNPKKLDLDAFNKMFDQTRMPDPDDDGYGDWLTSSEAASASKQQKFSGKFNRDVFNSAFEEANRRDDSATQLTQGPQALMLTPTSGVELGRDRPQSYTAAANANLKYTDLKQAYTLENTISQQVSNVRVEARDMKTYQAQRERAPDPFTDHEMLHISAAEKAAEEHEKRRQVRAAQEHVVANDYFERMKRMVITNQ